MGKHEETPAQRRRRLAQEKRQKEANDAWEEAKEDIQRHDKEFKREHPDKK